MVESVVLIKWFDKHFEMCFIISIFKKAKGNTKSQKNSLKKYNFRVVGAARSKNSILIFILTTPSFRETMLLNRGVYT